MPGSLALIGAGFTDDERGGAIGTWSAASALTMVIGPLLGGFLATNFSWRWVFFINVPIAVIVIVIASTRVPESRDDESGSRLDWAGAVLATIGRLTANTQHRSYSSGRRRQSNEPANSERRCRATL